MVDFRLSSLGSSLHQGQCGVIRQRGVIFLARLCTLTASLHPGIKMGTGEFNIRFNLLMDHHPIWGGKKLLIVTKCHRHEDKLWHHGPLIWSIFHSNLKVVPKKRLFLSLYCLTRVIATMQE